MTLKYDVDVHHIMPESAFADPKNAEMLKLAGIELNTRGNCVAKFRDPKTAAALEGADPIIKEFFSACGFAFIPSGLTLPAGTFDAKFDDHITDVARRMQENMSLLDPIKNAEKPVNWNGLNFGELIQWFSTCQPIAVPALDQPEQAQRRTPEKSTAGMVSLVKVALLGLVGYAVYSVI